MGQLLTNRHLIGELASWVGTAALLIVVALNFQLIRKTLSDAVLPHVLPTSGANHATTAVEAEAARAGDGVELHADRSGHFEAHMEVNGRPLEALVDTGATIVMLTYEDAARAGIYLRDADFTMQMQTANGIAKAAPVMLDRLAVGSIMVRNVQAGVGEPGLLRSNLLGMSFLKKLHKFEIRSGTLVLQD